MAPGICRAFCSGKAANAPRLRAGHSYKNPAVGPLKVKMPHLGTTPKLYFPVYISANTIYVYGKSVII